MKHCAKCDVTFPDVAGFCKKCGGQLTDDSATIQVQPESNGSFDLICANCGQPYRAGAAFCKGCGQSVVGAEAIPAKRFSEPISETLILTPTVAAPHATTQPSAAPITTEQTVKCAKCGTLNRSGMRFCKSCRAPIGEHARKVKKNRVVVAVSAGAAVFVVLVGLLGWYLWGVKVTIKTEPAEAKIAIDGKEVGASNTFGMLTVSHIRAGEHVLIVKHDRYDQLEQSFKIGLTDFNKNLNVKLNFTKYKLTVIGSPADSTILIDNATPEIVFRDAAGNLEIQGLAPGDHSVLVSGDGYRDWKQSVTINGDTKIQVTLSSAPVYDSDSTYADSEIRSTLEGWAQSTRNRDVDSHMRYYADTLDYYYARTLVSSSKVRDDRMRAFQKFNYLNVQLSNMNVQLDSTGQRATVVFDKTFDFRGDNDSFYNGSVQDQLTLTKLGGAWLITGEKELKVYYVNK